MANKIEPINIFDFDGTLTTETWPKCLAWVNKFGYQGEQRNDKLEQALAKYREKHVGEPLETFFAFFNDLIVSNNGAITTEELMQGEKYIKYNKGLNEYIQNTNIKNYIVSASLKEFLDHLKDIENFDGIYGTSVRHDKSWRIIGIDDVMTDDKKILAICNILKTNNRSGNDCRNVCYIGDGYSDAAAMKFVHDNGGKAIFVHQPNKNDELSSDINKVYELLKAEGIVDFCCPADYREGSTLSNILLRKTGK